MIVDSYIKETLKIFDRFYNHSKWDIFSDFLAITAFSFSNVFDKGNYNERERQYLNIVSKYTKDEVNMFSDMLIHVIEIFSIYDSEDQVRDVLGYLFEKLELRSRYKGQFFTPEHVCEMMSKITFDKGDKAIEEKGFITFNEPCCGSGRMCLSFANVLRGKGYNHQKNLFIIAQDIDINCVYMTYIQLVLYGIPAVVMHGDVIAYKWYSYWYTPTYFYDNWYLRDIFSQNIADKLNKQE